MRDLIARLPTNAVHAIQDPERVFLVDGLIDWVSSVVVPCGSLSRRLSDERSRQYGL
jgi:hypothetical protein